MIEPRKPAPATPHPISWSRFQQEPNATLAEAREQHWWAPVDRSGTFEVLAYDAVRTLLARDDVLRSFNGGFFASVLRSNPAISPALIELVETTSASALLNLEGDDHRRLRGVVSRAFTPRQVEKLRPYLEATAAELARDLKPGDDFIAGFAREFPARALCQLTGIPAEDRQRFIEWMDILMLELSPTELQSLSREGSEELLAAHLALAAYCRALVQQRRSEPQDDLVSAMATDPEYLASPEVIAGLVGDLIFAGNDTMRKVLGLMIYAGAQHPEEWERVGGDSAAAGPFVEEVLRLFSPAPGPMRQACTAFEHRGETFEEGTLGGLSIWSANRDPEFWGAEPDAFDPAREQAGQHLSFGHGPHFCLGASLAREELRAALVALSTQITDVSLVGEPRMTPVGGVWGPVEIRIDFQRR
jgi:hypothetical protein